LTYRVAKLPAVPTVLRFIQERAGLDDREAYGTWNMGAGFALFVAASDVPAVLAAAASVAVEAWHAGTVEAGPRRLLVDPLGLVFAGEELQVRA
jgi:phosphoribosylformylglycinamidine cyclo-ligase